ncbi:MAG: AAA family ATPase [Dialister invisus]
MCGRRTTDETGTTQDQRFRPLCRPGGFGFLRSGNHTLFLICGPTGAGKSTILDAMCYALYGKTSGAVRSGEDLRSNYVGYDRKTYVEFDFAIGNRHYRIYRSPTQLLERQKGDRSNL